MSKLQEKYERQPAAALSQRKTYANSSCRETRNAQNIRRWKAKLLGRCGSCPARRPNPAVPSENATQL